MKLRLVVINSVLSKYRFYDYNQFSLTKLIKSKTGFHHSIFDRSMSSCNRSAKETTYLCMFTLTYTLSKAFNMTALSTLSAFDCDAAFSIQVTKLERTTCVRVQ